MKRIAYSKQSNCSNPVINGTLKSRQRGKKTAVCKEAKIRNVTFIMRTMQSGKWWSSVLKGKTSC